MNAVYAGSFDCYTNGHHDIVKKAAVLFDRLCIVIAVNSEKRRRYPAELMQAAIAPSNPHFFRLIFTPWFLLLTRPS